MDTLRSRTALCACLAASSSPIIHAFTPVVENGFIPNNIMPRPSCCSSSFGQSTQRGESCKLSRRWYQTSAAVRPPVMTAMGLGGRIQREGGETLAPIRATVNRTERGQRLRALNWMKQVRNELTSAEFALNIDAPRPRVNGRSASNTGADWAGNGDGDGRDDRGDSGVSENTTGGVSSAIDFDSIAERLEANLRTLQAGRPLSFLEAIPEDEVQELRRRLKTTLARIKRVSQEGGRGGAGGTRAAGGSGTVSDRSGAGGGGIVGGVTSNINVNLKDVKVPEFDLFVRDDGTVDWDGAIQSGREVARFGQELWDRINGQNPHEEAGLGGGHGTSDRPPRELPDDSSVLMSMNAVGIALGGRLTQLQKELDALKADARAQEASWKTGAERRNAQRRIRGKEVQLSNVQRELMLHGIDIDMERICYLIEQDIRESAGTGSSSAENRLLVAEFGLLDAQLANLKRLLSDSEGSVDGETGNKEAVTSEVMDEADRVTILDEDELELVGREVLDLKNRLGMDLENPALTVDPEKIVRYLRETYDKLRLGVDFYWTGTKILGNDVGYAFSLISKAAQGSILKPREVRTLRRTGKDVVTFIPFVIILILPLTPVGHVLVFSAIQRLFPDFFPSSYTDRRQNLLKMYTEVEKKVDWEDSDPAAGGDDMLEKLRRNFSLTLNQAGDQGKGGEDKSRHSR